MSVIFCVFKFRKMGEFAASIERSKAKCFCQGVTPPDPSSPQRGVRGQSPPEAETLFASECSMETANSPIFLKFGNAKTIKHC